MGFSLETLAAKGVSHGDGEEAEASDQKDHVKHVGSLPSAKDCVRLTATTIPGFGHEPSGLGPMQNLARAAYEIEMRAQALV
jgi:hypothetical protein